MGLQNVVYDASSINARDTNRKPRVLDKAYRLIDKYDNERTRKKSVINQAPIDVNLDDDFGMLFDWAAHLDEDHLKDYEIS